MTYFFCVDKKDIDILDLAKDFLSGTGVKLYADKANDIVNGAVHGNHYPAGDKSGVCWSGHDLSMIAEEHTCIALELYDLDESPNPKHMTTIKAKKIKLQDMNKEIDKYCNKKKIKKIKVDFENMIVDHNVEKI